jgi:hypothetical protein
MAEDALFTGDVSAQSVRQGSLGSCYFHASVAALASARPALLRSAIQQDAVAGTSVHFFDGGTEHVDMQDVQFARSSGFDRSSGLWVSVLLQGFAQRTLRHALVDAIQASNLPLKGLAAATVSSDDVVMLAYDRAIRTEISQSGSIDRQKLRRQLRNQLDPLPLSTSWKERALDLLDSGGFFETLSQYINRNAELFGAYRAIDQGGVPSDVLQAFAGKTSGSRPVHADRATVARSIAGALAHHQAVVAWTGPEPGAAVRTQWSALSANPLDSWYLPSHAYTVLFFDATTDSYRLRNPWGNTPAPNGEFNLPAEAFAVTFDEYVYSGSEGAAN